MLEMFCQSKLYLIFMTFSSVHKCRNVSLSLMFLFSYHKKGYVLINVFTMIVKCVFLYFAMCQGIIPGSFVTSLISYNIREKRTIRQPFRHFKLDC